MTTPAHIAIADSAEAALRAAHVAGGQIFHVYPPDAALAGTCIAIGVESSDPERMTVGGAPVYWRTTLRVDCYSRFGVANPRPHEAISQAYADAYAALLAPGALHPSVLDVEPGPATWNYTDDERQLALVSSRFFLRHATAETSLATAD